jgi:hypothetical protein
VVFDVLFCYTFLKLLDVLLNFFVKVLLVVAALFLFVKQLDFKSDLVHSTERFEVVKVVACKLQSFSFFVDVLYEELLSN